MFDRRCEELMRLIEADDRLLHEVQARQLRALSELALRAGQWPDSTPADVPVVTGLQLAALEVGAALHLSRVSAEGRVALAVEACTRLPEAVEALGRGELPLAGVRIIEELTHTLTDEQCAQVTAQVLPKAGQQTPGQLRRTVRRAVHLVDPGAAIARATLAVTDRCVRLTPLEDGMSCLKAILPAVDAEHCYQALTANAWRSRAATDDGMPDAEQDDDRTMDQRRADVLRDVLLRPTSGPDVVTHTHVTIAVPVSRSVEAGSAGGLGVAELHGHGPLDLATMSELLAQADTTWRGIPVDADTGVAMAMEQRPAGAAVGYTPGTRLTTYIRDRDVSCRFPGCVRRAACCDLDHAVPHPEGPTAAGNLSCLCRFHHRVKTHTPWRLDLDPDGVTTWTSPTGRRYTTHPWNHLR